MILLKKNNNEDTLKHGIENELICNHTRKFSEGKALLELF